MPKQYRPWAPRQPFLFPPSPMDWLSEGHLAYFVLDAVEQFDLRGIEGVIQAKDPRGERPYPPRMMVALLLYGYCTGVFSSRGIERAVVDDIAFRVIAGGERPHFTTIAEFRRVHLDALKALFADVLKLCQRAGLVEGVHVHLDGTKVQANASKHKAMSYAGMQEAEMRLKREIAELFEKAEQIDAEEDRRFGTGKRAEDLIPEEVRRRETRLAWILKAKAELEEEARKARAATLRENAANEAKRAESPASSPKQKRTARTRSGQQKAKADKLDPDPGPTPAETDLPQHQVRATLDGSPKPKAQRNFTDPDSRIMVNGQGAFVQAYNCQAVVDERKQVVVALGVTNLAPDQAHGGPMFARTTSSLGRPPQTFTADNGFMSEAAALYCETHGVEPVFALGRETWSRPDASPPPRPPPTATARERMRWRLSTEWGRERMRRRKMVVEPVFGQIKEAMGFRRFSMRGLHKADAEWAMVCTAHNLLKLYRATAKA